MVSIVELKSPINKREYESQKNWIIELLVHQGVALIEKQLLEIKEEKEEKTKIKSLRFTEELRQVYRSLQKWIDINDEKVLVF